MCMAGTSGARTRTCACGRAREGLSLQTSLGSLSRQRILCCEKVGSPCVATGHWAIGAFGVATVVLPRGFGFVSRHDFSCHDSSASV